MSKDERGWVTAFFYLQVLDVLSTLIGFSLGNSEASPFIRLMIRWGPLAGLAISKLVAIGLAAVCVAFHRTALIRIINYWYAGLVIWNLYIVLIVLMGTGLPRRAGDPGEAIQTVAAALRHNNSPLPNAGIYTAFQFASPANLEVTGPYGRFLQLVKHPDYAPMLRDNPQDLGALVVHGDHAEQTLRVRSEDGHATVYEFDAARQAGGGWMMDGVTLVSRE